ncbi:MAG: chemotaxis protein histidine kinase CheA [Bermanella sp.]|jgi:chemotaxis protein histidine kinase CheA
MQQIEIDAELRLFFLDEAEALAAGILAGIQSLILGAAGDEVQEHMRRGFHTLKGGAAQISGCNSLAGCAHKAERLAQGLVHNFAVASPALLGLLADAVRAIIELINATRLTGTMPDYSPALSERLESANQRLLKVESAAMSASAPLQFPQPIVDAIR